MNKCDFAYESVLWNKGLVHVLGLDEVGRGAFAGPVVAGACMYSKNLNLTSLRIGSKTIIKIDDSKKLASKQRELASEWIKNNSIAWAVGIGSVDQINSLGIVEATRIAFRQAVDEVKKILISKSIHEKVDHLLVDAFFVPSVEDLPPTKQTPIIKGDEKSFSIASASIIAKVYRDLLMSKYSKISGYSGFGWEKNKGYGTLLHRKAIQTKGITQLHRKDFVAKYAKN